MATKRRAFDCVKMKDDIQAKILAEYEARKSEFASFAEFVNVRASQSPWVRKMRRRTARARDLAGTARRTTR